uniref:Zinc-hook domain-containing protein n=1 Tax=Arion vulgaris TaxID=1028688 RepID=A0A0B7AG76_9EUPU
MPPGSKGAGAAFVHDPKLAKEKEIKGQIKLMICDVKSTKCIVERSMTARVKDAKGKKVEMKTLDGVLTRVNAEGEKHSITSRCADLNREMIGALGVSKPVLENVIFCHQEDSCWPLSEAKVLKDKFDAIFASTRYTKVLEELKKLKQSQDAEIREGKKELDYLKQHKQKAEQFQADLEGHKADLETSLDKVNKINQQLVPIQQQLQVIDTRYNEFYKLQTKKNTFLSDKEHIEKSIQDLTEKIKEDFHGTTIQLKQTLREFSSKVEEKKDELIKFEDQQGGLSAELDKLTKEENALLLDVGKLQNEAEIHQGNIVKRDKLIMEFAELYEFEGFDRNLTIDDDLYQTFFQKMKGKLESMMEAAKRRKAEFEDTQKQIQVKIDGLKENKTRHEQSERLKTETMTKNNEEIKELTHKLNGMMTSADKLNGLTAQLRRAEDELNKAEISLNVDEVKQETTALDRQRKLLEADISDLDEYMNRLHKQSKLQTELDMLIDSQKDKEDSIARLRAEHEESITSLFGHFPAESLRESISVYISNQAESVRKYTAELTEMRSQLSAKQAERNSINVQIQQKEDEARKLADKISVACESQDIEEEISEVQRSLTQAQEEKGSLLGADHLIKKHIKNLEKNNPACPLCQRGFQQAQEVRELILKLQEQLRKVPTNMRKADEDVEKYQKKYDEFMQLRPVKENLNTLRDKDVPSLKIKHKKLEDDIKKIKEDVQNKEIDASMEESNLQTAKNVQPDVVDMDRRRAEVRELDRKIETLRAQLSGGGGGQSMETVIEDKEKKQLELGNISRSLDHLREKLTNHQDRILKLRTKVHDLQKGKLEIERELQDKIKLEERKTELTISNKNLQRDIDEARVQIKPLENQIQKLVEEKYQVTQEMDRILESARNDVEIVKNNGNGVRNVNLLIKKYQQSQKSDLLKENHQRQSELKIHRERKEEEQEEVAVTVKRLTNEISNQQIRERELQDTLKLRNQREEVKNLELKIEELEEQLGGLNVNNLDKERQTLVQKENNLTEEFHKTKGRQQGFRDLIKARQGDLDSDIYRNAHVLYTSKIIQNKTTEIVNKDLERYYGAMDKAIMMYHKSKMEEINIIMRELWKNTYTGNDIEAIEIQSEADDESTTVATIKNRRNYNYRVVMVKNGIPVDMRGRCSAGQKVLASLIIRLALAETFCVNCGVLALDEPTTNLDRKNIESLAFALIQIIKERSSQRHFQLVVITHDEDFVELLGRSEFVDEYIQVSKNADGVSRLSIKKVEELHI